MTCDQKILLKNEKNIGKINIKNNIEKNIRKNILMEMVTIDKEINAEQKKAYENIQTQKLK